MSYSHVDVGRLGQHTTALEQQTQVPSRSSPGTLALIDDHGVQESLAAHELDKWRVEVGDGLAEDLTEFLGTISKILIDQDLERRNCDSCAKGVAAYVISITS